MTEHVNNQLWPLAGGKERRETTKLRKCECVLWECFVGAPSFICRWRFRGVPFLQHQPSYSNAAHLTGEDNVKKRHQQKWQQAVIPRPGHLCFPRRQATLSVAETHTGLISGSHRVPLITLLVLCSTRTARKMDKQAGIRVSLPSLRRSLTARYQPGAACANTLSAIAGFPRLVA